MDVENCRQLIEQLLSSYVDGELDGHTSQSLELHVQMCPPCATFLRTFLATKRCARAVVVKSMPDDCESSLWSFLQKECGDELGKSHGKSETAGSASSGCGGAHGHANANTPDAQKPRKA